MKKKYAFVTFMLVIIAVVSLGLTTLYVNMQEEPNTEENFTIVTSFYPIYIMTKNVVGDTKGVSLQNLSEPQTGCLHEFQLTPEDMKLLSTADVFVVNGEMELFLDDIEEAYPDLDIICVMDAVTPLEEDGKVNSHTWLSLDYTKQQVEYIAEQLGKYDAGNEAAYHRNAHRYQDEIADLKNEQAHVTEHAKAQNIISLHEGFAYIAYDYGMQVSYVVDLDHESTVSAGKLAEIIRLIEEKQIKYVLAPDEPQAREIVSLIEKETPVTVIYIDPLNTGTYEATSYMDGMSENIHALIHAFGVEHE